MNSALDILGEVVARSFHVRHIVILDSSLSSHQLECPEGQGGENGQRVGTHFEVDLKCSGEG